MPSIEEQVKQCKEYIRKKNYNELEAYLKDKPELRKGKGRALLTFAIDEESNGALFSLLMYPDINVMQFYGSFNALQSAAISNNYEAVIILLSLRPDIDVNALSNTVSGNPGYTALMLAAQGIGVGASNDNSSDNAVYALKLMAPDLDFSIKDSQGFTASDFAKDASKKLLSENQPDAAIMSKIEKAKEALQPQIDKYRALISKEKAFQQELLTETVRAIASEEALKRKAIELENAEKLSLLGIHKFNKIDKLVDERENKALIKLERLAFLCSGYMYDVDLKQTKDPKSKAKYDIASQLKDLANSTKKPPTQILAQFKTELENVPKMEVLRKHRDNLFIRFIDSLWALITGSRQKHQVTFWKRSLGGVLEQDLNEELRNDQPKNQ